MYVCVCRAVTDRQIKQAVNNGACSIKDLRKDLDLGADCKLCIDNAKLCLYKALQDSRQVAAA